MSTNFQLLTKYQGSDMHVNLAGDFDGSAAWQLIRTVLRAGKETERILVNTDKIRNILPFGVYMLDRLIRMNNIQRDRVIFQGDKAHAIGFIDGFVTKDKNATCQCARCKHSEKSVRYRHILK